MVKGQGHTVTKFVTVAWLSVAAVAVLLAAWDCTSYDCLGFYSSTELHWLVIIFMTAVLVWSQ